MRTLWTLCLLVLLAACGGGGGDDGGTTDAGNDDVGTDDGGTPPGGPVVDQAFAPPDNDVNLPIGTDDLAQTFTVGIAGTLHSIDLKLSNTNSFTGTLRVDVRQTTGGAPNEDDGNVLVSQDLDVATLGVFPAFVTFDFSAAGQTVTAGEVLAIVVRRINGTQFVGNLHGTVLSPYGPGAAFVREPGNSFQQTFNGDFAFRTRVTP